MKYFLHQCGFGLSIVCLSFSQTAYAQDQKQSISSNVIFNDEVSQTRKAQIKYLSSGIPGTMSSEEVSLNDIYAKVNDENSNEIVWRLCFDQEIENPNQGGANPQVIGAIAAILAPVLIGELVDEVSEALEDEIAKYTVTHRASSLIQPYVENNDLGVSGLVDTRLEIASSCFRYSRYSSPNSNQPYNETTDKLLFDFVGQWRVSNDQHLQIRPLRVYFGDTAAPSKSKEVSLSVAAKVDGIWREENSGRTEEVFDVVVLTEKFNRVSKRDKAWKSPLKFYNLTNEDNNAYIDDFNSDTWDDVIRLPIIPYSKGMSPGVAEATFQLSVTEVGDGARRKILRLANKGLNLFEDDVTSALEEAATGLIGE